MSVDTSRERIEAIAVALNRAGFQSEARAAAIVVLRALLEERDAARIDVDQYRVDLTEALLERDAALQAQGVTETLMAARGTNRDHWESRALKAEAALEAARAAGWQACLEDLMAKGVVAPLSLPAPPGGA